ncbi:MAG: septation regulator SpoVG [Brevinematia bacterium]
MEITDIRIKKVQGENKLKAYASVTFDNSFVIHNIKVIEGNNGPFIAMPSRKTKNGELKDIAHPINSQFREKMQSAILEAYQSE